MNQDIDDCFLKCGCNIGNVFCCVVFIFYIPGHGSLDAAETEIEPGLVKKCSGETYSFRVSFLGELVDHLTPWVS